MKKVSRIILAAAMTAAGASTASAQVLFADNFEDEPVSNSAGAPAVGAPDIGSWVEGAISQGNGADIVASPAIGTRAMRITRGLGAPPSNGQMNGLSLPGALVAGNTVEVAWNSTLFDGAGHRFNNPLQVSIGHAGSNYSNDLAFIAISDMNGGSYQYNDGHAYGTVVNTTVQPSLNGVYDSVRVIMSLVAGGAPGTLTGTYDLLIGLGGGPEVLVADDASLGTTTIPAVDPDVLQFRIGTGPSTSYSYLDNIRVTVPEPAMIGSISVLAGAALVRRRR